MKARVTQGLGGLMAAWILGLPTAAAAGYPVEAVPFTEVELRNGFWKDRIRTNRDVTIPHAIGQCRETGRIDNFARAAGRLDGDYVGFHFNDSDVYKLAEALARQLAVEPDGDLQVVLDELIGKIAAAQQDDGYLHPFIQLEEPEQRWQNPHRHELFSIGHLIEAGAVHFKLSGRRELLDVAIRVADRVDADFRPAGPLPRPPEHQQIELGLVQLAEVTGERRYLELARRFLEARGRNGGRRLMGPYSQDHEPVAEQREAVGHAVRAMYQYAAMADIAAHFAEDGYRGALDAIWGDVFGRKAYVTGGVGSSVVNEGFGPAHDLPNASAYSETCASIGSVFWNERMFRLTGEARYQDVIERTLFNALLSGVSLEGDRFFYPNRLESFRGAARSEWFDCSCCPTNVVRFMPSLPSLAYAVEGADLYVNQFINSRVDLDLDGRRVTVEQQSSYPWDGLIRLTVSPAEAGVFRLKLRIPDWARGRIEGGLYRFEDGVELSPVVFKLNGEPVEASEDRGYAVIEREWRAADSVTMELPMDVRRVRARDEVAGNEGRVAVQRGPLVYCIEGVDHDGGVVMDLMLEDDAAFEVVARDDFQRGLKELRGSARRVSRDAGGEPRVGEEVPLRMIPYFAWAHRGATPMQVWLARVPGAARPAPVETLASTSRVSASVAGAVGAVNDQLEPRSSDDHSLPFFHWWPRTGTTEWIEYEFPREARVAGTEVYWFEDSAIGGGCRLPRGWRVLYRDGETWKPVAAREVYTVGKDRWSRVSFEPVRTTALRLEVELAPDHSAGIHEWKLEESNE
jgi:DUF1680 family protein